MTATIIDGKQIAAVVRAELAEEVQALRKRGVVPGLGVVLLGDDPASKSYVTAKEKACAELGLFSADHRLPAATPQAELLGLVRKMNADMGIHSILVQLPLPTHLCADEILCAIDPEKDADGFHPLNVGRMVLGQDAVLPCTPHAVLQMLLRSGVQLSGAHVVIVGRSNIVGKPLANMLAQKSAGANATVTICHTATRDIGALTRQADIVVAAAGRPQTITADMIKPGAVVIDVGVNRIDDPSRKTGFRLVGDVDFEAVRDKAGMITPVPGGVGPMTITMLLFNTVRAARLRLVRSGASGGKDQTL